MHGGAMQLDETAGDCAECAICLDPLVAHADHTVLVCSHRFHSSCILQSALHDPRCPICRATIARQVETTPSIDGIVQMTMRGAVDRDAEHERLESRRRQLRFDDRRRRLVNANEALRADRDAVRQLNADVRRVEEQMRVAWLRESRVVWTSAPFA